MISDYYYIYGVKCQVYFIKFLDNSAKCLKCFTLNNLSSYHISILNIINAEVTLSVCYVFTAKPYNRGQKLTRAPRAKPGRKTSVFHKSTISIWGI